MNDETDDEALLPLVQGFAILGAKRTRGFALIKEGLCPPPIDTPVGKKLRRGEQRKVRDAFVTHQRDLEPIRTLVRQLVAKRTAAA